MTEKIVLLKIFHLDQLFCIASQSVNLKAPLYNYNNFSDFLAPEGAILVGVELTDDAIDLPKFKHPQKAIYILGPEKGNLSNNILSRCKYTVRIPTKFCINIAMAGAIVMYDRVISLGQYKPRPVIFNQNN